MRKKQITYLLLSLVCMGLFSCSKQQAPADNPGEVAFRFEGIIDTNVVFEAGENNYYLNTDYTDDGSNDYLVMRGEFLDKSNPNDNYLRFEFYGYDPAVNAGILQNVFSQTNFPSYSIDSINQTVGAYTLQFNSIYGVGANINWDFGDGSFGSGDSVIHTFASNATGSNVSMTSFYQLANCGDSITNFIDLTDPVNNQVQFDVNALTTTLDSFSFNASPGFNSYAWDFGNQTTLQGASSFAQIGYNDSLRKKIKLVADKAFVNSTWEAVVTPNNNPCFAAFVYNVLASPTITYTQRLPIRTCIITYKKNGVTYRSFKNDNTNQSGRIVFTMSNAEAYILNSAAQRTIQLRGGVDTYLYNVNNVNDSIQIKSSDVSIAVAHP